MNSPQRRYSPAGFRTAVQQRLKTAALESGRPAAELQRDFYTQRFLARVFTQPNSGWVLLGGRSMLARLPGARNTQDVDLLNPALGVDEAVTELRRLADAGQDLDPLEFDLRSVKPFSGLTAGAAISVEVRIGATKVHTFPIDLSIGRLMVATIDYLRPDPVIEMDDVAELPPFELYPLPDQLADKFCTMYEAFTGRRGPSTRFRDLVDIVLILRSFPIDADATLEAIRHQEQRRSVAVPPDLPIPNPTWVTGYHAIATKTLVPADLHDADDALAFVRRFLTPLLTEDLSGHQWCQRTHVWRPQVS